jgi:hypothetical protein
LLCIAFSPQRRRLTISNDDFDWQLLIGFFQRNEDFSASGPMGDRVMKSWSVCAMDDAANQSGHNNVLKYCQQWHWTP